MTSDVAVIGAGTAGAFCARALVDAGLAVTVFDKGRSVGGRLAQRRREGAVFDHGAQFVRPRDPVFRALLEAGVAAGAVARWPVADRDGVPAFVGRPAMSAPVKAVLHGIAVQTDCRIAGLARVAGGWRLAAADGPLPDAFARVVLAVPPVQARELLASAGASVPPRLLEATALAELAPCWAGLLAFEPPLALDGFDARALEGGPIAWIARNTTKPGREGRDAWTVHAAPEWSAAHLEERPEDVLPLLLDAFRAVTGVGDAVPVHAEAHRWRYALVTRALGVPAVWDATSGLGLCGDWCLGGKVEAAFLSGRALAASIAGGPGA